MYLEIQSLSSWMLLPVVSVSVSVSVSVVEVDDDDWEELLEVVEEVELVLGSVLLMEVD